MSMGLGIVTTSPPDTILCNRVFNASSHEFALGSEFSSQEDAVGSSREALVYSTQKLQSRKTRDEAGDVF